MIVYQRQIRGSSVIFPSKLERLIRLFAAFTLKIRGLARRLTILLPVLARYDVARVRGHARRGKKMGEVTRDRWHLAPGNDYWPVHAATLHASLVSRGKVTLFSCLSPLWSHLARESLPGENFDALCRSLVALSPLRDTQRLRKRWCVAVIKRQVVLLCRAREIWSKLLHVEAQVAFDEDTLMYRRHLSRKYISRWLFQIIYKPVVSRNFDALRMYTHVYSDIHFTKSIHHQITRSKILQN